MKEEAMATRARRAKPVPAGEAGGRAGDEVSRSPKPGTRAAGKRAFVEPELTKHESLTRITLISGFDGSGSGEGLGGTFFG
jgi:hypothetical protein